MNYWTEFRCLSCARKCYEIPGKETAAWRSLARGHANSESNCGIFSEGVPKCGRCGGRLYAAETYQYYGSNPPWQDVPAYSEVGAAYKKPA